MSASLKISDGCRLIGPTAIQRRAPRAERPASRTTVRSRGGRGHRPSRPSAPACGSRRPRRPSPPTAAIPSAISCRAPMRGTRVDTVTRPATIRLVARPKSCQSNWSSRRRSTRSTSVRPGAGIGRARPGPIRRPHEQARPSTSWRRVRPGDLLEEDGVEDLARDGRGDLAAQPPRSAITTTTTSGSSSGAKAANQAWSCPALPLGVAAESVCAVPVLPAMSGRAPAARCPCRRSTTAPQRLAQERPHDRGELDVALDLRRRPRAMRRPSAVRSAARGAASTARRRWRRRP